MKIKEFGSVFLKLCDPHMKQYLRRGDGFTFTASAKKPSICERQNIVDLASWTSTHLDYHYNNTEDDEISIRTTLTAFRNIERGLTHLKQNLVNDIQQSSFGIKTIRRLWATEGIWWLDYSIRIARKCIEDLDSKLPG